MNERQAEILHGEAMRNIILPVLGNGTTFSLDLDKIGRRMFGQKFAGVFASDMIPKLNNLKKFAILNLDKSTKPGSHWIAVAFDKGDLLVYDSFGRKAKNIIPALKGAIDSDLDAEQKESEDNCGQRSLAWLHVLDKHGRDAAMLI